MNESETKLLEVMVKEALKIPAGERLDARALKYSYLLSLLHKFFREFPCGIATGFGIHSIASDWDHPHRAVGEVDVYIPTSAYTKNLAREIGVFLMQEYDESVDFSLIDRDGKFTIKCGDYFTVKCSVDFKDVEELHEAVGVESWLEPTRDSFMFYSNYVYE